MSSPLKVAAGPTWSTWSRNWLVGTSILMVMLAIGFGFGAFVDPLMRPGFAIAAVVCGLAAIGCAVPAVLATRRRGRVRSLTENGIAATAAVMSFTQTGATAQGQPFVHLDLKVTLPTGDSYLTVVSDYVPLTLLGALTSGKSLLVHVDRANRDNVAIDWTAAFG